jgi:hypothetical protein
MTPFLTIASALIEYSRYQSATETLQEVVDLSTFSTLSQYDTYVQDRFGLFSLSQDCDPTTEFNESLDTNIALLDKGVTNGGANQAYGSYPLSNLDVLKTQVMDFSESTVLSDFLLEDLNIQELIDKLNNLKGLTAVANAASDISNLATAIKELVEAGNALVDDLQSAYNSATAIKSNVDVLLGKIADLYKKLSEDDITINADTDFNAIINEYKDDVKGLFDAAKTLYDSISVFTTAIGKLPTDYNNLTAALNKAKAALEKAKNSSSASSDASRDTSSSATSSTLSESTSATTGAFETVINELDKAVTRAAEDLKDSTINNLKNAANQLKDDLYTKFKLSKYLNLNEYLSLPLSDEAKADLKQILSKIPSVWTTNSYDEVLDTLYTIYVPDGLDLTDISTMLDSLKRMVSDSIAMASANLEDRTESSLSNILTTLVKAVKELFNLDIFYDGNLNAYLSDACAATLLQESTANPFATLLEAIEKLFSASEQFVEGLTGFNILKVLGAVVTLLDAVKTVLESIVQISQKIIAKISELAGYISSGKLGKFYELLLLSAYITHDLPNRTHSGDTSATVTFENGVQWSTTLEGHALTGFDYKNIVVPPQNEGPEIGGLNGLATFLAGAQTGGTDTMFRGAELEYVVAGTKSEIMNQAITFLDLYLLRMLMDIPVVFGDNAVKLMASSATIAAWAVYVIVLLGEPLCDAVLLVNSSEEKLYESYLLKKSCYLSPAGIGQLLQELADRAINNDALRSSVEGKLDELIQGNTFDGGGVDLGGGNVFAMDYETHMLLILLISATENDMLTRLANIIQLESTMYYSKTGAGYTFDIHKTYTCITSETTVTFNSFLSIFEFNDMSIFTRTYKKTRGY